jgi:hypothetical protein
VKRPGQRTGHVSGALAQTLDVTPTIANAVNVPLGYHADGRSVFGPAASGRQTVRIVKRDFSSVVSISKRRWIARRAAVVRRRLRELGSGDWPSLFTAYPQGRELIGQHVGKVPEAGRVRATLSLARSFAHVRSSSGVVPCEIAGRIDGSGPTTERDIAVAVNGRIEAVGRSFHLRGERVESYSVMVPETSLHNGRNTVEVLEVGDNGHVALLARS